MEVGAHPGTITRWQKSPDFRQVIEQARLQAIAADPEPRAVLKAALSACDREGRPEWRIRVQAAMKLIDLGPEPSPALGIEHGTWYEDVDDDEG